MLTAENVDLLLRNPCCDCGNNLFDSKNWRSFLFAIFSITFETALRRLTGLYLVLSVLFPLFLNRGMHFDIFQLVGKTPLWNELLMIQVSGVAITSAASLSNLVDIKSTPLEVFDFMLFIFIFLFCT